MPMSNMHGEFDMQEWSTKGFWPCGNVRTVAYNTFVGRNRSGGWGLRGVRFRGTVIRVLGFESADAGVQCFTFSFRWLRGMGGRG